MAVIGTAIGRGVGGAAVFYLGGQPAGGNRRATGRGILAGVRVFP
ncbi:MAG: hypothetical protein U5L04_02755 [Trueperaceae bacterium]|nr:hypothetical protein [Trueperaceae bacterium]